MIFASPLFNREEEKKIISLSPRGVANAGNTFQWNLLDGLYQNSVSSVKIINALPVGVWPKNFRKLILKDKKWRVYNFECIELGCLNIPLIKQFMRYCKAKRLFQSSDDNNIVISTAYLPFLQAAKNLPKEKQVNVIITDIPEFYDIHKTSSLKKVLRKLHNKIVYNALKRVDKFVILTEQMKEPLRINSRPYLVLEGMYNSEFSNSQQVNAIEKDKDKINLLYTGRLNYKYGLKTLLAAFEKINNDRLILTICGSGEMKKDIEELSKRNNKIIFGGFKSHSEILQLQKKADVLINPRTNSGEYTKYSFPSKTMEYMASGTPVIMYKLDGVPDEYDEFLYYVPDNSVNSLAATIEKVTNMDKTERKERAERAQKFILDNKNCQIQALRFLNFLES